jgi:hypothetical protein
MIKKELVEKLFKAIFLGLIGLVFGFVAGGLFADIGIATYIPWTEILTFLGGIAGFFVGFADDEK